MKLRERHTRPSTINEPKKLQKNATFIDNVIFKEEEIDIKISPTQTQDLLIPRQNIANHPDTNNHITEAEPTKKSLVKSEDMLTMNPGT